MNSRMKTTLVSIFVVLVLPATVIFLLYSYYGKRLNEPVEVNVAFSADHVPSTDHMQFAVLQQDFSSPHEVTEACLSCHTGRDEEIMATAHWKWEREEEIPGRGVVNMGKKNLINNFCTGATGNNGSCMRCHIGYGWEDKSFDFADSRNVDCLVCHDRTQTYYKKKGDAGYPATAENQTREFPEPDYSYVAGNVGLPTKHNCGICHFYGGGGNNVKHGDLEEALLSCSYEVDVHMSIDSLNMSCIDCHKAERHNITGKLYSVSAENKNRVTCSQCHSEQPHQDRILDAHNQKVACQTCHIPTYAKVNATKLYWDWSSAGQLDENGRPYMESDADGNHNYLSIKGNFVWDDNVEPEYYWFNGTADHYLVTDTITEIPVRINRLFGDYHDPQAKIWPVKVHRGKQPYDVDNNTLLHMKLYADSVGMGAFWRDFDWQKSAEEGMSYNGREYSGNMDFVASEVYWPINHMVSPKEETLTCTECHSRDGRLASLTDFYLPGRDYDAVVEYGGIGMIILLASGVLVHALIRIIARFK